MRPTPTPTTPTSPTPTSSTSPTSSALTSPADRRALRSPRDADSARAPARRSPRRAGRLTLPLAAALCAAAIVLAALVPVLGVRRGAALADVAQGGGGIALLTMAEASPDAVAAAGLTGAQAATLYATLRAPSMEGAALDLARHNAGAASRSRTAALDAVRRGGRSAGRTAALDAAASALESAESSLAQAESAARALILDAVASAAGSENAALASRTGANAQRRVPEAWRALDLGAEAWATLESAWVKHARGLPSGAFTGAELQALSAAQTSQVVAAVEARRAAQFGAVQAAWGAAVIGGE